MNDCLFFNTLLPMNYSLTPKIELSLVIDEIILSCQKTIVKNMRLFAFTSSDLKVFHKRDLPYCNAFLILSNPRCISVKEVAKERRKFLSAPNPSPGTTPTPTELRR